MSREAQGEALTLSVYREICPDCGYRMGHHICPDCTPAHSEKPSVEPDRDMGYETLLVSAREWKRYALSLEKPRVEALEKAISVLELWIDMDRNVEKSDGTVIKLSLQAIEALRQQGKGE